MLNEISQIVYLVLMLNEKQVKIVSAKMPSSA